MPKKRGKAAKAKAEAVAAVADGRAWDVQAVFTEKGSLGLKLSDKVVPGKVAIKSITEGGQVRLSLVSIVVQAPGPSARQPGCPACGCWTCRLVNVWLPPAAARCRPKATRSCASDSL